MLNIAFFEEKSRKKVKKDLIILEFLLCRTILVADPQKKRFITKKGK